MIDRSREPGPSSLPAGPGSDWLQRAISAFDGRRFQEAERIAGQALKTQPRDPRALQILGSALLSQGRAQEAVAPLEAAASGRRDPVIETALAIALHRIGRNADALAWLKRATEGPAPYPAAFQELGRQLTSLERYDEAVEAFQRGLQIAPMMPELSVQLGDVQLRRRHCTEAKLAFARALEIAPGSADALFGIALAHQYVGENEPAAAYYRRYLTMRPGDARALCHLGRCLLASRHRDAGYECFRTAARQSAKHYGQALTSLAESARGRFWLKPSVAQRHLLGEKS